MRVSRELPGRQAGRQHQSRRCAEDHRGSRDHEQEAAGDGAERLAERLDGAQPCRGRGDLARSAGQHREHRRLSRPVGRRHEGVDPHQDQERHEGSAGRCQHGARRDEDGPRAGDGGEDATARMPLQERDVEDAADRAHEEPEPDQAHRHGPVHPEGVDGESGDVAPLRQGQGGEGP